MLLGERIEMKSALPSGPVLNCLAGQLDRWKLGLVLDAPGERDFIGRVEGSTFQIRQRHRFWGGRFKPTVVGTVVEDGRGSVLKARFRAEPWNRLAFLILLAFLFASTSEVALSVGEAAFLAMILGINVLQVELAKRPVRDLLRNCTTEPATSLRWVMS